MQIIVCPVGRLRTPGLELTQSHLLKLTQAWGGIEIRELRRKKQNETETDWWASQSKSLPRTNARWTRLDESGKSLTTARWAETLQTTQNQGVSAWVLWIGDADGWPEIARQAVPEAFCLGPQTLAHDLARIVLLEQLYRAQAVLKGHPYHRE